MTPDPPDLAERAEALRELQVEALERDPDHTPLVMCARCGHTVIVPQTQRETTCARGHPLVNPHFAPASPTAATAALDTAERLYSAARARAHRPERAAPVARVAIIVAVYLAAIAGLLALLRMMSPV